MQPQEAVQFHSVLSGRRHQLEHAASRLPGSAELQRLLGEVDSALERLNGGTYGLCDVCHDPIEPDRLRTNPLARFCLDHLDQAQIRALEDDLHLAQRIQSELLPKPGAAGVAWSFATHYQAAGPVSGDYCDVLRDAHDGAVLFLAGDVSGKGVAASLLMSQLHAIFRSLVSTATPLTVMLERANRLFSELTPSAHYATLVCAAAGPTGTAEVANAGHCPALHLSASGVTALPPTGLPLGLFCDGHYESHSLTLAPGDALVFYSDGLSEAPGPLPAAEPYGEDRLLRTLSACHGLPAQVIIDACLASVHDHMAGASPADDLTLLVIRRTP